MAGKPKAPVPERRLAVTRLAVQAGSIGKQAGTPAAIKALIAQGPKR